MTFRGKLKRVRKRNLSRFQSGCAKLRLFHCGERLSGDAFFRSAHIRMASDLNTRHNQNRKDRLSAGDAPRLRGLVRRRLE
jgi:hypothetical protein